MALEHFSFQNGRGLVFLRLLLLVLKGLRSGMVVSAVLFIAFMRFVIVSFRLSVIIAGLKVTQLRSLYAFQSAFFRFHLCSPTSSSSSTTSSILTIETR